jgi:hypothetical protein
MAGVVWLAGGRPPLTRDSLGFHFSGCGVVNYSDDDPIQVILEKYL